MDKKHGKKIKICKNLFYKLKVKFLPRMLFQFLLSEDSLKKFFNYSNFCLLQQITISNLSSFTGDDANKILIYQCSMIFLGMSNTVSHIFGDLIT